MKEEQSELQITKRKHLEKKMQVYKYVDTVLNEKHGAIHFKSLADNFTESRGLDHIFRDLNRGDEKLRNTVLKCVAGLMNSDDLVCIKFMKLKLVSNIIRHFIDTSSKEHIDAILVAFQQCKHREVLL